MTQPKPYYCSFTDCGSTFPSAFRLKRHLRGHTGERPFICDIDGCDKSFTCRSYLNKHKKRPHGAEGEIVVLKRREKRYTCEDCVKEFKDKFLWKVHLAQHTGEKPYKCDKCDASFAMRSRLLRHNARHEGYPCRHEGCNFIAETWSNLRKHVASDHKEANECPICGKCFTKKSNLQAHIEAHKYKCPVKGCDKSFVFKGQLKEHVEFDHQECYTCQEPNCGRKFTDPITLAQHSNKHSGKSKKLETSPKPKKIFPYRKSLASELSGFEPNQEELTSIIDRDKQFRKEMN